MNVKGEKRLGIAMSGAAARSVFYLGFLEVLKENEIPIHVIAAQSGASIVASAYACGTMDKLKTLLFELTWMQLYSLFRKTENGGGLFSLSACEEYIRHHITTGKSFHEVDTVLSFPATNLNSGEVVSLGMGDIAHGIHATCAIPGLFAPVHWGRYELVDGGLLSIVPGKYAREAGADVVIGVDAKATRHIFMPVHITAKAWYIYMRNLVQNGLFSRVRLAARRGIVAEGIEVDIVHDAVFDDARKGRTWWQVVNRSLDLVLGARGVLEDTKHPYGCDLVISQGMGSYGDSLKFSDIRKVHTEGRKVAEENLQQILDLLNSK